jgi:YbbR domain-containing protein
VVLTSVPVDTVRATIRDKGWVMMVYLYTDRLGIIQIPFKNYDRGRGTGTVGTNDLKRIIESRLELSSKVTAVKPDHMEFSYNNGECRRVPIRWAGRVIPDQLYFISHVEYLPDSVEIYASTEKLDSIRAVYTEALNYVNFRDSLTVDCQLAHINDVKIVPDRVRIRFHTDVLTEETISNVPIRCLNLPEGKVLRTFPRYAKVHFVAGVSQIRSLRAEDFLVVADFREIMVSHKEKCNLYLREVPRGVSRAVLETKQVDYLIEEE